MKKSLLILSMMTVAASATAYDQPVAGTAEAPNYYVITANRGVPYLGYDAQGLSTSNGTTNLVRTDKLTTANVWEVTPGTAEGSVVIKNHTADAWLLKFFTANVATTIKTGGTATTVAEKTDIFLVDMGGAYAININSAEGAEYPDNCITLDATGGDAVKTCGNYVPTPADGTEGGCWWFTKVTPAAGQSLEDALAEVEKAFLEADVKAAAEESAAWLEAFIPNVPQAAQPALQTGIDQLKALPATEDYADKITEIEDATIDAANAALATALNDQVYAIKNPRRASMATTEGAYLTVNTTDSKYVGSTTFATDATRFTFKAKDNGYVIYNASTQTYIGLNSTGDAFVPVTEASAQVFQVVLGQGGDNYEFIGVSLVSDATADNGLNWQSWNDGKVSPYSITDGGSIYTLEVPDNDVVIAEAAAVVEADLTPYFANVPDFVKTILEKAIADAKALPFSIDVPAKALAIRDKAIADANAALATELNDKVYAMKYLRGGDFLNLVNNNFTHADEATAATAGTAHFTFKSAGNGGYKIYNAEANAYVGPLATNFTVGTDEATATVVYPALVKGSYTDDEKKTHVVYGLALCLTDKMTEGNGLNMNAGEGLYSWYANDGGSVWSLVEPSELNGIESVSAAPAKVAVEGIYDLSGRKLSAPVRGINIINGKKVFVK